MYKYICVYMYIVHIHISIPTSARSACRARPAHRSLTARGAMYASIYLSIYLSMYLSIIYSSARLRRSSADVA